jgi:hypothetical protein
MVVAMVVPALDLESLPQAIHKTSKLCGGEAAPPALQRDLLME